MLKFFVQMLKNERIEVDQEFFDDWLKNGNAVVLLPVCFFFLLILAEIRFVSPIDKVACDAVNPPVIPSGAVQIRTGQDGVVQVCLNEARG